MKPFVVVSADAHAAADHKTYVEYWEPGFDDVVERLRVEQHAYEEGRGPLDRLYGDVDLDVVDERRRIAGGGVFGGWDVKRRLEEMDGEGVAAEIVIAGHQLANLPLFGQMNSPQPPEYRFAGVRAHHRWLADQLAESDGRVFGIGDPGPTLDMDATLAELRWIAERGFVSVALPGIVGDPALPPLLDDYYEPFWATCDELGLALNVHAAWGLRQGRMDDFRAAFRMQFGLTRDDMASEASQRLLAEQLRVSPDSPMRLTLAPRRALWQLMMAGVFDRHPNLKLVLTEVRGDWVPGTIAHLDARFDAGDLDLAMKPSEYWARNCAVTPSSPHRAEVEMRDEIGVECFLFGSDYPHPEGTWPNTNEWIRHAFEGVSERDARLILGENAIRIYGLDRNYLGEVAARIGQLPTDLLVDDPGVAEVKLAAFDFRAGYRRAAEIVNPFSLDVAIDEDRVALAATS